MTRALSIFDPFAGFDSLQKELLSLPGGSNRDLATNPTTDIYTTDDGELVVEAHLPNFREEDVTVSADAGTLTIRATQHEEVEEKKRKKYLVRESSSTFIRSVVLPEGTDADRITAGFQDGVLRVVVPLPTRPEPKQIPVASSNASAVES